MRKTVGVIVNNISDPFFAALLASLDDALAESGRTVLLCNTGEKPLLASQRYISSQGLCWKSATSAPVAERHGYKTLDQIAVEENALETEAAMGFKMAA